MKNRCCYKCSARSVGCHAKCPDYQKELEISLEIYKEREKMFRLKMDLNTVKSNSINRMCRRDNRHYK